MSYQDILQQTNIIESELQEKLARLGEMIQGMENSVLTSQDELPLEQALERVDELIFDFSVMLGTLRGAGGGIPVGEFSTCIAKRESELQALQQSFRRMQKQAHGIIARSRNKRQPMTVRVDRQHSFNGINEITENGSTGPSICVDSVVGQGDLLSMHDESLNGKSIHGVFSREVARIKGVIASIIARNDRDTIIVIIVVLLLVFLLLIIKLS